MFTVSQAADFLGVTVDTLKYHMYRAKNLIPDGKFGHVVYFTEDTLRDFQTNKRPAHRPAGSKDKKARRK